MGLTNESVSRDGVISRDLDTDCTIDQDPRTIAYASHGRHEALSTPVSAISSAPLTRFIFLVLFYFVDRTREISTSFVFVHVLAA